MGRDEEIYKSKQKYVLKKYKGKNITSIKLTHPNCNVTLLCYTFYGNSPLKCSFLMTQKARIKQGLKSSNTV